MKRLTLFVCAIGMCSIAGISLVSLASESANADFIYVSPNMRCVTTIGGNDCSARFCWSSLTLHETEDWYSDQIVNAANYEVCGDPGVSTSCEVLTTKIRCATYQYFTNHGCMGVPDSVHDREKNECRTVTHQGPGGGTGGPGGGGVLDPL